MCFDLDSRPPIAPIAGGSLDHGDLVLEASDGNRLAAFQARATDPSGAGIVILPDVRGLHPYYEELALRFAEVGVDAVAFDYFGRTAGIGKRGDGFDYPTHVPQTTPGGLRADIAAAVAEVGADPSRVRSTFTIGFCFGGRVAFLTPSWKLGVAGAIGFYGFPVGPKHTTPAPADRAALMEAPILGLFGGADPGITPEMVAEFDRVLAGAEVKHELISYPGAPHSFFDRKAADYADASADAWRRTLAFIEANTTPA